MYHVFQNWWYSNFQLPATFANSARSFWGGIIKGYSMHNPLHNYTLQRTNYVFPRITPGATYAGFDIPDIRYYGDKYRKACVHASSISLKLWQSYQPGTSSFVVLVWPSKEFNTWIVDNTTVSADITQKSHSLQWLLRLPHVRYAVIKPNSIDSGNHIKLKNYMSTKKMAGAPLDQNQNYDELTTATDGGTSVENYQRDCNWYWNIAYYNIDEAAWATAGTKPFEGFIKIKYYTTLFEPRYPITREQEDTIVNPTDPGEDEPPAS